MTHIRGRGNVDNLLVVVWWSALHALQVDGTRFDLKCQLKQLNDKRLLQVLQRIKGI